MKLFSLLLVGLALLSSGPSHATLPTAAPNSAAVAQCGTFIFVGYVVGHGANLNRAEIDANNKMWEIIFSIEFTTGKKLTDLEITGEGPIGDTMYFIEFVATFE